MSGESQLQVGKIFRDPIHGHIVLDTLLVKIIDTPQFQRLRNIKQLGGKYHVYPGASHNRFEHSIGVAHLAGELVQMLKQQQSELEITDDDVLCVKIAGLCHDLGHGPFSHVFDGYFIKEARKRNPQIREGWRHEVASAEMFDHMLEENGLQSEQVLTDWPYYGRGKEKSFLYEIIANKETGIDVDKWDYFERDCYYMGLERNFDMRRTMKLARVINIEADDKRHICIRDKEAFNLYQMFHTRFSLHKRAYMHPTANGIELMIRDTLIAADEYLTIPGMKAGEPCNYKMSEAIEDMRAYTLLTDHVMHQILMSTSPDGNPHLEQVLTISASVCGYMVNDAQYLFHRIQRRDLYTCAVNKHWEIEDKKLPAAPEISTGIMQIGSEDSIELKDDDFVVDVVKFNYGMGKDNPIDKVWFYTKEAPNCAKRITREKNKELETQSMLKLILRISLFHNLEYHMQRYVSAILPETFEEQYIRVYCKQREKATTVEMCFEKWYDKQSETHSQETPLREGSQPTTVAGERGTSAKRN